MQAEINKALNEKGINTLTGRTAKDSAYEIVAIPIVKSKLQLILVGNRVTMGMVAIYWNTTLSYAVDSVVYNHYTNCLQEIETLISNGASEILQASSVDNIHLEIVLTHDSLKQSTFAQSLAKQFLERGKLSDKQLLYIVGPTPNGRPPMQTTVLSDGIFSKYYEKAILVKKEQTTQKVSNRIFSLQPTKSTDVTLIPTTEHKYYQYPFPTFNPVQSLVFKHIESDANLIVGANTSAGKTICAEMLMDAMLAKGKKIIYLSPLKSLTQEKYSDWSKRYSDKKIEIMTGDYSLSEAQVSKLRGVDIICMTSEMLDSRTRKFTSEKNEWLYGVGLLVCDESHIIGSENRGHACETGIMRFTKINPESRVLLLSATMPNVEEFSDWLTALNGKTTDIVYCNWRPVVLNVNYTEYDNTGSYNDHRMAKIAETIDIVISKPTEKFLLFVHDKTTGRELVRELKQSGVTALFHNADLDINERLKIEEQFRDKQNGLRVLVATSTLAWGVNLPARNVVIVGVHRGINEVDELDLIQMMGRAGRYGIDDAGFVYMVVPSGSTAKWKAIINNPKPVTSGLKDLSVLAFHILSEIHTKNILNEKNVKDWYLRSLAYVQQIDINENETEHVIQDLINMRMIKKQKMGGVLTVSNMGMVSALMYYSPYDIYDWYRNLEQIHSNRISNENILAWALSDVPSNRLTYIPKNMNDKVADCRKMLNSNGIDCSYSDLTSINSIVAACHCFDGTEPTEGGLRSVMRAFQYDAPRIIAALEMLDANYAKWDFDWKEIAPRIMYGVSKELLGLVKIDGVGKARAEKLHSLGFVDAQSVAAATPNKLQPAFTMKLAKDIIENAKKVNAIRRK